MFSVSHLLNLHQHYFFLGGGGADAGASTGHDGVNTGVSTDSSVDGSDEYGRRVSCVVSGARTGEYVERGYDWGDAVSGWVLYSILFIPVIDSRTGSFWCCAKSILLVLGVLELTFSF